MEWRCCNSEQSYMSSAFFQRMRLPGTAILKKDMEMRLCELYSILWFYSDLPQTNDLRSKGLFPEPAGHQSYRNKSFTGTVLANASTLKIGHQNIQKIFLMLGSNRSSSSTDGILRFMLWFCNCTQQRRGTLALIISLSHFFSSPLILTSCQDCWPWSFT